MNELERYWKNGEGAIKIRWGTLAISLVASVSSMNTLAVNERSGYVPSGTTT